MTDISKHPLLKACYEACLAVEKLRASRDQTDAVMRVSDMMRPIETLVDQLSAEQAARAATKGALEYLVDQIRKGSPVDDHGHPLLNNMAYIKAVELLVCAADAAKEE